MGFYERAPPEPIKCKLGNENIGWGKCSWHNDDGQCSLKKCKCDWDDRDDVEIEAQELEQKQVVVDGRYHAKMRCPRCGEPLQYVGKKEYVNLSEHVACLENNPMWHPPLRATFACKDCFPNAFYDEDGEIYGGMGEIPHRYWDALGSWAFESFFRVNADMQKSNPGYEEDLRLEKLKLPDCPKVKQ